MAWTGSFTDTLDWSSGNYLYENWLNQMVANDDYLREQASYVPLVNDTILQRVDSTGTSGRSVDMDFLLNSSSIWNPASYIQSSGHQDKHQPNISISSAAEGLAILESPLAVGSKMTRPYWRFMKTQEIEFLSIWVRSDYYEDMFELNDASVYAHGLQFSITVIGHRISTTW